MKAYCLVLLWHLLPGSVQTYVMYDTFAQCERAAEHHSVQIVAWVNRNPSLLALRKVEFNTITELHMETESSVMRRETWMVSLGEQEVASATCEVLEAIP